MTRSGVRSPSAPPMHPSQNTDTDRGVFAYWATLPLIAPLGLIIAPTRELALQVQRELRWLYEDAGAIITSEVSFTRPHPSF